MADQITTFFTAEREEFQVNSSVAGPQDQARLIALAGGGFVVVWHDANSEPVPGSPGSFRAASVIRAQIHDANGIRQGGEFVVGERVGQFNDFPAVAALPTGGFVASWDDSAGGIRARIFDKAGARVGSEIAVQETQTGNPSRPDVAVQADGGFLITWHASLPAQNGTPAQFDVRARTFAADGVAAGGDFIVGANTAGDQVRPRVATLDGDRYLVTFDERTADGTLFNVRAQILDAAGVAIGGEITVNGTPAGDQFETATASLAGGGFVVTWSDSTADGDLLGIHAQVFDAAGAKIGTQFVVNTQTAGNQSLPAIVAMADGGFVISWTDDSMLDDPSATGIKAQQFDATGGRIGEEFLVNVQTELGQLRSAMTVLASGKLVVAWEDRSARGEDSSASGIKAQILDPLVRVLGTTEGDELAGGETNDAILGLAGADTLTGNGGNDQIDGDAGDDSLTGDAGDDLLFGGEGDDLLDGGDGEDFLFGGAGDDVITDVGVGRIGGDGNVLDGGDGDDVLTATGSGPNGAGFMLSGGDGSDVLSVSGSISSSLNGGGGDDQLTGTGGSGFLLGGDGNDDITSDARDGNISGEAGSDTVRLGAGRVVVDVSKVFLDAGRDIIIPSVAGGFVTIIGFAAGEAGDRLDLTTYGADPFRAGGPLTLSANGPDTYIDNSETGKRFVLQNVSRFDLSNFNLGVDTGIFAPQGRAIDGRFGSDPSVDFADQLIGADGDDVIRGFGGGDLLFGGGGNDQINGGDGDDIIEGGSGDDVLNGNGGNDMINGNAGNDVIDGGTGADRMAGGAGDDLFFVDTGRTFTSNGAGFTENPGDIVVEEGNAGTDEVRTTVDYMLAANVENLTGISTTGGLSLTGNSLTNIITGTPFGDTITGSLGADRLIGGAGDDAYDFNAAENVIVELAGGGTDTVRTSFLRFTLGANLENLIGTNTQGQTLTGNDLNNFISTNDGADFIDARGGGDDRIVTRGGNDAILFGAAYASADSVDAGAGIDQMGLQGDYTGSRAATLTSVVGVETLILQSGDDARFGDTANNSYSYDVTTTDANVAAGATLTVDANRLRSGETSTFNGGAETDGRFAYIGGAGRDDVTTGAGDDVIRLGAGGDVARAGAGNDLIDGGAGQDLMFGGAGDDIYIIDEFGDTPVEDAGAGTDEVRSDLRSVFLGTFANVENLTGTSATGQTLGGNALANVIRGAGGNDFIDARQGGDDDLFGNAGDDAFLFAGAMTAADRVDGGVGGNDQLGIQGDYTGARALTLGAVTNIETLLFLAGDDNRFGNGTGASFGYAVTTNDANVAAGATLTVDANRLRPGENVVFDGSAETDGGFFVYAGRGVDRFMGGSGSDIFLFREPGGFTAADRVVGGAGFDQLGLRGDYTGAGRVVMDADTLLGLEGIVLLSGRDTRFGRDTGQSYSYDLATGDGAVTAGQTFTVDAGSLRAGETLRFSGSMELDGNLRIFGGSGDDVIRGGFGDDAIRGGLGADRLDGFEGADLFRYDAVAESTAAQTDVLVAFQSGRDKIDLSRIDADQSNGAGNDAFRFIGSAAFSGSAGELRTVYDAATRMGRIEGDVNGDGVADLVIALDGLGGDGMGNVQTQLTAGDFNF